MNDTMNTPPAGPQPDLTPVPTPDEAAPEAAASAAPPAQEPGSEADFDRLVADLLPDTGGEEPYEEGDGVPVYMDEDLETAWPAEEDEERAREMTRTVQLSIEKLMAQTAEWTAPEEPSRPAGEAAAKPAAPEEKRRPLPLRILSAIGYALGSGLLGLTKWLLLVAFFVALIAGAGVAWLYSGATTDLLPQITVSFDGLALEPTAYDWNVPVVGDLLTRRYRETMAADPLPLPQPVQSTRPRIEVSTLEYDSTITVWDADGRQTFAGSSDSFQQTGLSGAGQYTAELVLRSRPQSYSGSASVTGSQTYRFSFEVSARPVVLIDSLNAMQGSLISVSVSNVSANEPPAMTSDLGNGSFVAVEGGWLAVLPVPMDQAPGTYELHITARGFEQTQQVTVRERSWTQTDYDTPDQLPWAYLGPDDIPQKVTEALAERDNTARWVEDGFALPYDHSVEQTLAYGTTEYVGRTPEERTLGFGTGRLSINAVLVANGHSREPLISPAAGRVLVAEDLGGAPNRLPGYTVVIEHGCGLKSVFYNLLTLDVKAGDVVEKGQQLGTHQLTIVGAVYFGQVPVEPLAVWNGQGVSFRAG